MDKWPWSWYSMQDYVWNPDFQFLKNNQKSILFWYKTILSKHNGNLAFQKCTHHFQKSDASSLWRNQMDFFSVKCKTVYCVMFSAVRAISEGRGSTYGHHSFHLQLRYEEPVCSKPTVCRQQLAPGYVSSWMHF